MDETDESFLDELFDDASERLRSGEAVDPGAWLDERLDGREHLRERAVEAIDTARSIYRGRANLTLELPGYEIEREIGRGAMGVVYLARQKQLGGRRVALKVLPTAGIGADRARRRFLGEARAIARIQHPSVIPIHDVVEDETWLAYAMEWIEGRDLAAWIQAGGGSDRVSEATRIGAALARALEAVHSAGLLHRDVKPSNVLLREDPANVTPILIDFGLAKDRESSMHTQAGAFIGTLAYAAPEQIRGEEIDARADIYGLGATLYHAVAGQLPFEGTNSVQVLKQIEAHGTPPLRRVDRHLPRDLETVIGKAMDQDPRRRYATAGELADDLERILALRPIGARPIGPIGRASRLMRRNAKLASGAAAGFLLTLAVVLALVGWRWHTESVRRRAQELTRQARITLLETQPTARLRAAHSKGYAVLQELVRKAVDEAAAAYDRSLELLPDQPEARAERDGLAQAARAFATAGELPELSELSELPPAATPLDLRAAGLAAYCTGDLPRAIDAWEALDDLETEDAFLQGLLGHVYSVENMPARAYHRLLQASDAFPTAGSLHLTAAGAALRCGETRIGAALLARAEGTEVELDPLEVRRLRFMLDHLTGRAGQSPERMTGNPIVLAEVAEAQGQFEQALVHWVNMMPSAPSNWRVYRGLLRCARSWWGRLDHEERTRLLEESLTGGARAFGSVLGLLASVESARSQLAKTPRGPTLFTLEAETFALDPAVRLGEPAVDSIDGVAMRAGVSSLDTERCASLGESERRTLVRLWLSASAEEERRSFVDEHVLALPEGVLAFGRRALPPQPPFEYVADIEPFFHTTSEFWRHPFATAGDLDGDGFGDGLVYGATGTSSTDPVATVRAISGKDGSTLYAIGLGSAWLGTGSGLAALSDRDGDGAAEWVTTSQPSAAVALQLGVHAGSDGRALAAIELPAGSMAWGSYLAVLEGGDAPGIAVAEPDFGEGAAGRVQVVELDGRVRFERVGRPGSRLATSLASVGDVNGDGVSDLVAGTEPLSSRGAYVAVLSGADGQLLYEHGGSTLDFGWRARASGAGDVDADGVPDIAVGCFPDSEDGPLLGRAIVFSGATGDVLLDLHGERPHAGFGEDVHGLGDLDGDGRGEVAVSSWGTRSSRPPRVEVFGADGERLAVLPTFWRLRPLGDHRFLALRLGIWSRYAQAPLGGEGSGAILEWTSR